MRRTGLAVAAVVMTALGGCGGGSSAAPEKSYDVRGKVVGVDRAKPAVTLDHEDIPGLMKAMTMDFPAADPKVLDGLAAGDAVVGKVRAGPGGTVVIELRKR